MAHEQRTGSGAVPLLTNRHIQEQGQRQKGTEGDCGWLMILSGCELAWNTPPITPVVVDVAVLSAFHE